MFPPRRDPTPTPPLKGRGFGLRRPLAALRETGMVTPLGIAVFGLKERVGWQRGLAVGLILGGAVMILVL